MGAVAPSGVWRQGSAMEDRLDLSQRRSSVPIYPLIGAPLVERRLEVRTGDKLIRFEHKMLVAETLVVVIVQGVLGARLLNRLRGQEPFSTVPAVVVQ